MIPFVDNNLQAILYPGEQNFSESDLFILCESFHCKGVALQAPLVCQQMFSVSFEPAINFNFTLEY